MASAVAMLVIASPGAVADTAYFLDRGGDARPNTDIGRAHVVNQQRIVVNVVFDDLRRNSGGLSVYYDTRGPDRGPEYLATGGLFPGSDFQMSRIERWNDRTPELLMGCDLERHVNYEQDHATFDADRRCFEPPGTPSRIRVAAKATSLNNSERDWAPKRKRFFYLWVRR